MNKAHTSEDDKSIQIFDHKTWSSSAIITFVNNCPKCDCIQSIHCCKLLYVFRVVIPPIIRSTQRYLHHLALVVVSELLPPAIVDV